MQLKVMTFNVRGTRDSTVDGLNAWEHRRALNIATIQNIAPDIMGFQEVRQGNRDAYEAELSDYTMIHGLKAPRSGHHYEQSPIFWKSSRFQKVDSGQFFLSETPDIESIGWDAMLVRVAAWVKLRDSHENQEFVVLNTHFPHEMDKHETRQQCANLIVRQVTLAADDLPVIVMGDFNATPNSPAYRTFLDSDFVDTYTTAEHAVDVNTFHDFKGTAFEADGIRIDWILTQGFATLDCTVITDAEPPLYPSDHYPLVANVKLSGQSL